MGELATKESSEVLEFPTGMPEGFMEILEKVIDGKIDTRMAAIEARVEEAFERLTEVEEATAGDNVTVVCFSGDFDRLIAAFIITTGAVAMGMEASIFFTFWGLTALKKKTTYAKKTLPEKMIGMMLPGSAETVGTSRLNMLGMGPLFFKTLMKKHNVQTLPELIELARELEVEMIACQMSMGIMGITRDELWDDITYGGVAAYLGNASDSKITLFI